MAETSTIEWTDATWNPITGCSVVSPGCTNCYAMRLAGTRLQHHPSRNGLTRDTKAGPVWNGTVRLNERWLTQPLQWTRPRRIFVCAHGDLFAEGVPDAWIDRVFAVMGLAPFHTFQVLTKRAARMRDYLRNPETVERVGKAQRDLDPDVTCYENVAQDGIWPLSKVWLGVSAEDQRRADERVPLLLVTPAALRFVSAEPLLGPLDLTCLHHDGVVNVDALNGRHGVLAPYQGENARLDWIIVGGESGPGARPMHSDWARSLRDQCADAAVPFHFKQWGAWAPDGDLDDGGERFRLIGKKAAGRLLDGREHNGMPEVRHV